jgi:MAP3K TRAFs-binding domain
MPPASVTSETHGIRGRIHKGAFDVAVDAGDQDRALATLGAPIDAYEAGMRADLRDYYPGVNAVTLRLRRGTPADLDRVRELAPVVRFAVEAARAPGNDEERYWQTATRLELASAARDWAGARRELTTLLGVAGAKPWMRETTAKNLGIQREAFRDDQAASQELGQLIEKLLRAGSGRRAVTTAAPSGYQAPEPRKLG